jgi:release factor glutamine methyltransferase
MSVNIQTIKDIRNWLARELNVIYPRSEISAFSNIIIKTLFGIDKLHQFYDDNQFISPELVARMVEICNELKTGRPIQYIFGETSFYGCIIKINNESLIPRPETEELVDLIIKENPMFNGRITDMGTGSGCIAIALAKNFPDAQITGTDISEGALSLAKKNAQMNEVHVSFIKADILNSNQKSKFPAALIVSNPPYIRESEKQFMNKNVLDFEPHSALFVPDNDPLLFYRSILDSSKRILSPGGKIYFEINEAMGKEMCDLFVTYGFSGISIIKDINGKDRIIRGIRYD